MLASFLFFREINILYYGTKTKNRRRRCWYGYHWIRTDYCWSCGYVDWF